MSKCIPLPPYNISSFFMLNFKNLSIATVLAASLPLQSQAVGLTPVGSSFFMQAAQADAEESRTIISEDFSGFAAGSEETPDSVNIANLRTGVIDSKYTAVPGWTGAAVYQTGGICAILTGKYSGDDGPYEDTGFLRTPMGDYAGAVTVSFRARLLAADATSDVMAVILNSPAGRLEARTVDVTPQWQNFSLEFKEGLFSDCLFEISMLKEKVLIDDMVITSVQTSIPAPVALSASDFSADGFTANWAPTAEAESYAVTLYERDSRKATSIVDFESLNLTEDGKQIVSENSGLPEGWTFAYGNGVKRHVSDGGADGSTGMVFAGTGDGFRTPVFERSIRDFSFYAAHPSGVACFSQIRFSCLVGSTWVAIGNIDIERIDKNGEHIDLSSRLPDGTTQIQMIFNKNTANDMGKDISIVIDNIRLMTDPEATPVIVDRSVSDTSAVFDGLDPDTDYSYTVKAVNSRFTSAPSADMMALGLASPQLSLPADVTDVSYTARWSPSPKADGYMVSNYRVFTAPEDQEVNILYENFDKVTKGSLSAPVGLYNTYRPLSLDEYTSTPGWLGLCTYLVKGMLGTRSYFTAQGSIQTPALNLSADDGRFKVRLLIVGDTDAVGDSLVVQAGPSVFKRSLISESSKPLEMIFDFDCGEDAMPLLIYSYGGRPFYIDEIVVSQRLKKGQQIFTETEIKTVDDRQASSVSFDGLKAADNESFAYRVFAYRDFYGSRIFSLSDAAMHVSQSAGIDDALIDSDRIKVSADGLKLVIDMPEACMLSVYGVSGLKVADIAAPAGQTTISLPAPGLYLVATDSGFTAKVAVR